jgi:hypothetical protein
MNKLDLIDLALAQGWILFPLPPRCKVPRAGSNGFYNATNDKETIHRWHKNHPDANWAIATGEKSNLTVIDIDPPKGGDISWEIIQDKFGPFPDTVEQQTGNGRQLFFQYDARIGSKTKVGDYKGIDTRSRGGYVVCPPSIHPEGRTYTWLDEAMPGVMPLAKIPEAFIKLATLIKPEKPPLEKITEGSRNDSLFALACKLRRAGLAESSIKAALRDHNQKSCVPPLKDYEVDKIAANGSLKPAARAPDAIDETPIPPEPPVVTNILQVTEEAMEQPMEPDTLQIWTMLGVEANRQGTVAPSVRNMLKALDGLPEFKNFAWWDDFYIRYFTTWKGGNCKPTLEREWTDIDDLELMVYFQNNLGLGKASVTSAHQALEVYARRKKRNEPKDWLQLPQWDGDRDFSCFQCSARVSMAVAKTLDFRLPDLQAGWESTTCCPRASRYL